MAKLEEDQQTHAHHLPDIAVIFGSSLRLFPIAYSSV